MKKIGFFLAAAFCLAVVGSSVSAQTTYTWNQTGTAAWTTDTNWTPTRTTPAVDDVLVFDNAATTTVTAVPTQTIGQLSVSGGTNVTLQAGATATLTIAGGTGTDLSVAASSQLNVNTAVALTINVATGATGVIDGSMTLSGGAHRLTATDASGIVVGSGGTFTAGTGFSGNPFGTTNLNSVAFGGGSTYVFIAGSNPFGAAQPSSVVVFQANSLFLQTGTGSPAFSGRTYADFELNNAAAVVTATGGSATSINKLTITAGTLNFNMTGTPGHSIKRNISVASGATLNFAPLTPGTVNLNGTVIQTISGAGTLTFNDADQTVVFNNPNGFQIQRDLTISQGTLTLTLGNITTLANNLIIGSAATVNHTSGHVIGNLRKTLAAAGSKTFEVGTANGYSPVAINVTAGTFPADFTVKAVQGPHPAFTSPQFSLQRYWSVIVPPNMTLDVTLNYLAADVPGTANEASFVIFAYQGGTFDNLGGTDDPPNDRVTTTGQNTDTGGASDLVVANGSAPTAADGRITGRTIDGNGTPISGAIIYLNGTQNRKTITDANGIYQFENVETSGFYTVTPSRVNYFFNPGNRSFSQLGNQTEAAFTGSSSGNRNPLDTPEYFVRQHYLDFLSREPDESGFNFWSDQILGCGNDSDCVSRRTVNVSAAYFLSVEFQQTGGMVDRLYKASFGRSPRYVEFMPDTAAIARGVIVGRTGWQELLAANKEAFVASWTDRAAFHTAYDNLSNAAYVDALVSNTGAGFAQSNRDSIVSGLNAGTLSRGQALQQIANNENFARARFNEAFVMMEYFGYLRRDPDAGGYQFWLDKLNQFDGNFERADMVKAFIDSGEYRARFAR